MLAAGLHYTLSHVTILQVLELQRQKAKLEEERKVVIDYVAAFIFPDCLK
jgi:hypothetical protein